MRKVLVATMVTAMLVFSVALAGAVTLGTITGGSGTATSPGGSPYSFSGTFLFDTTNLGAGSMTDIFGTQAFTFAANSAGILPAYDYNADVAGTGIFRSNQQWIIGNNVNSPALGDSRLYGSVGSFTFDPSGTVTGTLNTDGYIHWYYGYDDGTSNHYGFSTQGMTSLASWGLSNTLNFNGTWSGTPGSFNLTGTVSATPTPIPGALVLFGSGLLGLVGLKRRSSRKA